MEYKKESHLRSVLKGLSWRILATLTTIAIVYLVTGEIGFALNIGVIEVIAKIVIYYLHERAWQLVPRGTVRKIYERKERPCREGNSDRLGGRQKGPGDI